LRLPEKEEEPAGKDNIMGYEKYKPHEVWTESDCHISQRIPRPVGK